MKNKHKNTEHKHKPVANRHRKVHKGVGFGFIILWLIVVIATAAGSIEYIRHHRTLTINKSGVTFEVTKVSYDDRGSYPFEAPRGWKFVIIDATVQNNSEVNFDFAPVVQTYIADSTANYYYMSPATLSNPISAGPIKPHLKVSGQLSYLVPIKAKNITFHFEPYSNDQ